MKTRYASSRGDRPKELILIFDTDVARGRLLAQSLEYVMQGTHQVINFSNYDGVPNLLSMSNQQGNSIAAILCDDVPNLAAMDGFKLRNILDETAKNPNSLNYVPVFMYGDKMYASDAEAAHIDAYFDSSKPTYMDEIRSAIIKRTKSRNAVWGELGGGKGA